MENLRYGAPDASPGEVRKAAIAAGVHNFVASLPDGYKTILGENGLSLSEGQKQRLSLARALIKEPDIYILDEPTASLDNLSELSILDAMADLFEGKTAIIVTHSHTVIKKCDKVILLDQDGQVTTAKHDELSRNNMLYNQLLGEVDLGKGYYQRNADLKNSAYDGICSAL
jgi:ABC-type multidrug transport system fused ATPase/permease subunit